jgi:hypothetical protein
MQDTHHTYETIHQEHHAWRKYLLEERKKLTELETGYWQTSFSKRENRGKDYL